MTDVVVIVFTLYLTGKNFVEYRQVCRQAYTISLPGFREVEFCGKRFTINYHTDINVKEVDIKETGCTAGKYPTEVKFYEDIPCDGFTISTDKENEMLKITVNNAYDD